MAEAVIIRADVLDALAGLEDGSFDACLTDPPYGLKFMGKQWDHGVPGEVVWKEVLRVLNPGAMLLAFGGTRTHHRMMVAIEDAGFEIRDCLMWLYGSGFPKSLDISKAIDKAAGAERKVVPATVGLHKNKNLNDDGWSKIGTDNPTMQSGEPATPAAATWQGYGTALKPAWEPVILAMKPCAGTFAENALEHGVAGLNVDSGRIGTGEERETTTGGMGRKSAPVYGTCARETSEPYTTTRGRWPANVLLDEDAAAMLDREAGEAGGGFGTANRVKSRGRYGDFSGANQGEIVGFGDSGGPSRFFYTAKASGSERGEGNTHPTVKPVDLTAYLAKLILPPKPPRRLLVPFCGSGSEIIGAMRAGWDQVTGIEIEAGYADIAERRIIGDAPLLNTVKMLYGNWSKSYADWQKGRDE